MKRLHVFAGLLASLLAFPAGTAVSAQVYKWVDERGVVNYSSQLPIEPETASKAAVVEDRISVYSPDPVLVREIEANRQRIKQAATEKPEVRQPAVAMIGSPAPAPSMAYEAYAVEYPYWFAGGFKPLRSRPLYSITQVKQQPGAIAGTIVGMNGMIPGNTSSVPGTWSTVAPQAPSHHRPATFMRRSWER